MIIFQNIVHLTKGQSGCLRGRVLTLWGFGPAATVLSSGSYNVSRLQQLKHLNHLQWWGKQMGKNCDIITKKLLEEFIEVICRSLTKMNSQWPQPGCFSQFLTSIADDLLVKTQSSHAIHFLHRPQNPSPSPEQTACKEMFINIKFFS